MGGKSPPTPTPSPPERGPCCRGSPCSEPPQVPAGGMTEHTREMNLLMRGEGVGKACGRQNTSHAHTFSARKRSLLQRITLRRTVAGPCRLDEHTREINQLMRATTSPAFGVLNLLASLLAAAPGVLQPPSSGCPCAAAPPCSCSAAASAPAAFS